MERLYTPFLKRIHPGAHILDAGCGSGRDSLYFLNKGYKVTAMDASEALVELSSKLIGQPVLHMCFQQLDFQEEFDAVWACASLLHVSDSDIDDVLHRISKSLKPKGIFYASFKCGDREETREGRYFRYHNEDSFKKLLKKHLELEIIKMMKTADVRKGREDEFWLNVFLRKI